jgi:group I intron endonuclease
VPIQKYFKIYQSKYLNHKIITVRNYSTNIPSKGNDIKSNNSYIKIYEDIYTMRKDILKENVKKSGIYMLTNKITGDIYIGQSIDISNRFKNYLNLSYIKSKNNYIISRALIKYGYSNFSLTILEYCDLSDLSNREQYYFDLLIPQYNILKIAGSSKGFKHSESTKNKISKALKGVYVGENSASFGRTHTEVTKEAMSLKKIGINNPLYGKFYSEITKELIRQKALNRKHSDETKLKMSTKHGNAVNIYEKFSDQFKLIGTFVSARRAAKFLGISGSTVIKYIQSGSIFKDRYKFSSK